MGDVTAHFSRREFACRDGCGLSEPHPLLYPACEAFRAHLGGVRVDPSSGTRCAAHNVAVGGGEASQHMVQAARGGYSTAVDLVVEDRTLAEMYEAALSVELEVEPGLRVQPFSDGGIGLYLYRDREAGRWRWFVHCDIRDTGPARWAYFDGRKVTITRILQEEERLRRRPTWPLV